MSKPILTKKVTRNDTVYNLELWSPPVSYTQQALVRKGSGDISDLQNGNWSNPVRHQEGFDDWFDKLPHDKRLMYGKAIDESNKVIIMIVWELLLAKDRREYFNNNLRQFSNWFSDLEPEDVDFYMSRIMSKRRLMPAEFNTSNEVLTEEEITEVLEQVYSNITDDLIRATTINGLLCISCTDEVRLKTAKAHMIQNGSILRDYRKKQNSNGRVIYTYIFSRP